MTPDFAEAVDKVFLKVLGVLDRIGRGESPEPKAEKNRIKNWLHEAEGKLGRRKDWELAKYGIISWIDEVLIDAPWEYSQWWNENKLETELLGTNDREWSFYVQANEATKLQRRDALEVYYVAVVLGFRGIYRDPLQAPINTQALNEQYASAGLDLPDHVEGWVGQMGGMVHLGQGRPGISDATRPVDGAAPLEGPFLAVWAAFLGAILFVLVLLFWWLFL